MSLGPAAVPSASASSCLSLCIHLPGCPVLFAPSRCRFSTASQCSSCNRCRTRQCQCWAGAKVPLQPPWGGFACSAGSARNSTGSWHRKRRQRAAAELFRCPCVHQRHSLA